jgi:hypothetical protein
MFIQEGERCASCSIDPDEVGPLSPQAEVVDLRFPNYRPFSRSSESTNAGDVGSSAGVVG